MENMPEFNDDRREFFRINDSVYLDLKPIQDTEIDRVVNLFKSAGIDDSHKERQQISALQNSFSHVVEQINQTDREVARALRLLSDKIDIVSQMVNRLNTRDDNAVPIDVNLSGGGLSVMSQQEYERRQAFEFKIELRPSATIIQGVARVVGCNQPFDAPAETPYVLRLVFSHMSEHDRNLLVKHTLTRQAEILRAAKNENNF